MLGTRSVTATGRFPSLLRRSPPHPPPAPHDPEGTSLPLSTGHCGRLVTAVPASVLIKSKAAWTDLSNPPPREGEGVLLSVVCRLLVRPSSILNGKAGDTVSALSCRAPLPVAPAGAGSAGASCRPTAHSQKGPKRPGPAPGQRVPTAGSLWAPLARRVPDGPGRVGWRLSPTPLQPAPHPPPCDEGSNPLPPFIAEELRLPREGGVRGGCGVGGQGGVG